MIESSGQCRGLPEVAPQLDNQHAAVDRGNLFQQFVGTIARSVVDEDELKTIAHLFHHLLQARIQDGYVFLLVMKRNDDGILWHTSSIDARKVEKERNNHSLKQDNYQRKAGGVGSLRYRSSSSSMACISLSA